MKLSNRQIIDCVVGLNHLGQKEYPLETAFKIENLRKSLEPFATSAQKMIDEIKKKYAIKTEGNKITFNPEQIEEINEQINFIADGTKDFDDNLKIPIGSLNNKEIAPNIIRLLWEVLE